MRYLSGSVLAAVFVVALSVAGVARADFLSGTEDVPLMAGLAEAADGALVFDTPAGRIVEVTAGGPASPDAVRKFYDETLPQLGWTAVGGQSWHREGEVLRLEFPAPGTVRFVVAPMDGTPR